MGRRPAASSSPADLADRCPQCDAPRYRETGSADGSGATSRVSPRARGRCARGLRAQTGTSQLSDAARSEQVGARYRLPWELLAGIGKDECDHGRPR
jgi:hypothetical protein